MFKATLDRLCKLKVTCSNTSVLSKMTTLGEDFDAHLQQTRNQITQENTKISNLENKVQENMSNPVVPAALPTSQITKPVVTPDASQDSPSPALPLALPAAQSPLPLSCVMTSEASAIHNSSPVVPSTLCADQSNLPPEADGDTVPMQKQFHSAEESKPVSKELNDLKSGCHSGYAIVFDNIDLLFNTKHMSTTNQNKVVHWINHKMVTNRVSGNNLQWKGQQRELFDVPNNKFLPSPLEHKKQRHDYIILVSRTLVEYFECFKPFKEACMQHIKHKYSNEMSKKSEKLSMLISITYILMMSWGLYLKALTSIPTFILQEFNTPWI